MLLYDEAVAVGFGNLAARLWRATEISLFMVSLQPHPLVSPLQSFSVQSWTAHTSVNKAFCAAIVASTQGSSKQDAGLVLHRHYTLSARGVSYGHENGFGLYYLHNLQQISQTL